MLDEAAKISKWDRTTDKVKSFLILSLKTHCRLPHFEKVCHVQVAFYQLLSRKWILNNSEFVANAKCEVANQIHI